MELIEILIVTLSLVGLQSIVIIKAVKAGYEMGKNYEKLIIQRGDVVTSMVCKTEPTYEDEEASSNDEEVNATY